MANVASREKQSHLWKDLPPWLTHIITKLHSFLGFVIASLPRTPAAVGPFWIGLLSGLAGALVVLLGTSCLMTNCMSQAFFSPRPELLEEPSKFSAPSFALAPSAPSSELFMRSAVMSPSAAVSPSAAHSSELPQDPSTGEDLLGMCIQLMDEAQSERTHDGRAVSEKIRHYRTFKISQLVEQVTEKAPDNIRERCIAIIEGRPGSLYQGWSQAGQDWLLFHNFFYDIPYGKGTYIDLGSNHPEVYSNTYFFDRCLGWRGVCVEPHPRYYHLYSETSRSCTFLSNCISDIDGTKNFPSGANESIPVGCKRLPDILVEHNLTDADLASIDMDGAETALVRCFPLEAFRISTWLAPKDKDPALATLFIRGGYANVMDILSPVNSIHSNLTRVGWALDSVYRLQAPLILGPDFLPGRPFYRTGPQGACQEGRFSPETCPEQAPVIERGEVNWTGDYRLMNGACPDQYPEGYPELSRSDFLHPLRHDPSVVGQTILNPEPNRTMNNETLQI